ncbi:MAG: hypothetical protein AAFQ91_33680, partial [Cyanobacteria bacterium J06621_15]
MISINATPTVLVEEENTQLTITLTSSEPIPEEGLVVGVDSDIENALGQFDLFTTQFENVQLTSINDDISGFEVRLNEQTGTIIAPVFDDNDADGPQSLTFNLEPGEGYTVDESADSVTITIEDADSSTIPDSGREIPTIKPVFGSINKNIIEVKGNNQLIFAGDSNDTIDASIGISQASTFPVEEATIAEINQAFDDGTLTSEELVKLYLNRIDAFDKQGASINSIITINPEALATEHRNSPNSLVEVGNRIYAGSGDDTLILGSSDRIIAGVGDDKFFTTNGGNNIITGGAGADQFWIATAEIPEAVNI